MWFTWDTFVLALAAGILLRLVQYLFIQAPRRRERATKVMVVLGSGGHTGEMIGTLRQVPEKTWEAKRVVYVVSATDKDSAGAADLFEREHVGRAAVVRRIPRAREVGQSYVSSVFSTLKAFALSVVLLFDEDPDVVLTNGPGVCIPVAVGAHLVAFLMNRARPSTAYFESFTCVDHLSVSGKIMLRVADVFTVQWKPLYQLLGGARRKGLHWTGPDFESTKTDALLPRGIFYQEPPRDKERLCLVTVGSTKFDALMQQVDTAEFYDGLVGIGINDIIIQKGRSEYTFTRTPPPRLMTSAIVEYKPHLAHDIRRAALVISHAGAGTILEALNAGTPTVVVPNRSLMSNHQLQLANALADAKFLLTCDVQDLNAMLLSSATEWATLRRFPRPNAKAIQASLQALI